MKFRIVWNIAVTLVLLLLLVPAPAAQAQVRVISLTPTTGTIGTSIRVIGQNFNKSTETTDRYALLVFSSQSATTSQSLDTNVTIYKKVRDGVYLDTNGNFDVNFPVSDVLNDGTGTATNVTTGTYYVYALEYNITAPGSPPSLITLIRATASFTVTAGTLSLSATKGTVDTQVTLTGSNFIPSTAIEFRFDGTVVPVRSGATITTSTGTFSSAIVIPDSPAGAHTISAIVSGYEAKVNFTVEPKAVMTPTSGLPDAKVTVIGTGYARRKAVNVYFNKNSVASVIADAAGNADLSFTVPKVAAGSYNVEIEDADGNLVTLKFTVQGAAAPPPTTPPPTPTIPAAPTVTLTPIKGFSGTEVVAGGVGFKEGATVSVKFDDKEVASVKAGAQGIFISTFRVPAVKAGDHAVTISDGTKTEKITFKVEATVPPAPQPVAPEMGVEVAKDFIFDWRDVAADNPPVTYILQVAGSPDFSEASIIIEKKGLTQSAYTPTDAEVARLEGRDAPYYWRVRTIDAGGNEGNWTGSGEFIIPKPFSLPNWAKWAIYVIGAIVLLFVGYWIGRRSAYSY